MGSNRAFFQEKKSKHRPAEELQTQMLEEKSLELKSFSDEEMIEANHEILLRRNTAIRRIEEDTRNIHEMFKDVKALVDHQQPIIEHIATEIHETKIIAKSAEKNLLEAEEKQKRWCLIM